MYLLIRLPRPKYSIKAVKNINKEALTECEYGIKAVNISIKEPHTPKYCIKAVIKYK